MTENLQDIERLLTEAYQRQALSYGQALSAADTLFANWSAVVDVVTALQPINAVVDDMRHSNSVLDARRRQWLQSGRKAGPELADALRQCAGMIERLRARIGELEHLAAERKQGLTPQLDNLARGWRMQRAYAASGKA